MSNNSNDLLNEVMQLLSRFIPEDTPVCASSHFIKDLELDSVKVMELIMELEDHFDISIPLNSLPDVHTVSDLAVEITKLKEQ